MSFPTWHPQSFGSCPNVFSPTHSYWSASKGPLHSDPSVITKIRIENFKSIADLTLKLGRVTVLIGENGSGKSNILEAIGFAAAAAGNKLDDEVLFARGIRVTDPEFMASAFPAEEDGTKNGKAEEIRISVDLPNSSQPLVFRVDSFKDPKKQGQTSWHQLLPIYDSEVQLESQNPDVVSEATKHADALISDFEQRPSQDATPIAQAIKKEDIIKLLGKLEAKARLLLNKRIDAKNKSESIGLPDFLIYAPENSRLRGNSIEGFIRPLGTRGEGLFALLQSFTEPEQQPVLTDLKKRLDMFGWFKDFHLPESNGFIPSRLQLKDRWLAPEFPIFDQRSANEGFLFVLFYFALTMSQRTPRFFAIDNIDAALNPKLCSALMRQLVELAKKYDKQVICTTHNPAILDGLDLHDDDQRLYTVQRDTDGRTGVNRVKPPKLEPGTSPMKLSIAFLNGLIGGLPENF